MMQLFSLFKVNYITHKGTMICTPQKKCWMNAGGKGVNGTTLVIYGTKQQMNLGWLNVKKLVLW